MKRTLTLASRAESRSRQHPKVDTLSQKAHSTCCSSCYCGDRLDPSTASEVDSTRCTTPCEGNATEACGGINSMSVYKLATANDIAMLETINGTSPTGNYTSNEMTQSANDSTSPGAVAGIAIGTIIGLCALLATILLCVKWRKRRVPQSDKRAATPFQPEYQLHLQPQQSRRETTGEAGSVFSSMTDSSNDGWTTTSATASSPYNTGSSHGEERVTIGDATMVDLKRLSGIVVDAAAGRSSPRKGVYALQDGRTSGNRKSILYIDGNIRQIDVAAASSATGSQWRHTQNLPLTPRTPRNRSDSEGHISELQDDEQISPLVSVQEPGNIAQNNGLGERAWHRRRLSIPFLPSGGESERSLDDMYGSSRYEASGRSSPNWRPATGVASSIVERPAVNESVVDGNLTDGPPTPRPLRVDVVTRMYDDEDDGPALSPSWFWTVQNMSRFSDAGTEKISKVD